MVSAVWATYSGIDALVLDINVSILDDWVCISKHDFLGGEGFQTPIKTPL